MPWVWSQLRKSMATVGDRLFRPQEGPVSDGVHRVHASLVMPADVALDDLAMVFAGHPGEGLAGPVLIADGELVTAGQRGVLDEQAAHVLAGARRGEGVEHGVGDGHRAGQAGEELRDVGLSDPGQPAVGSFH
jgi:hypothetical protein